MRRILVSVCALLGANSAAQAQEQIGGYVTSASDGQRVLSTVAKGIANAESGARVTPETVFHIASLSKQITAAALATAILEGKVSLNDPLLKHIPEAAHFGEALTIAHLLYFTSGLTEAYDRPRESGMAWSTFHYFTVDEAIAASLSVEALQFPPGSEWRYNNINFQLIAEVVERAYGRPFSAVVKDKIFVPLGMDSSLIHDDVTAIVPNRANGIIARTPETVASLRSVGIDVAEEGGPVLVRRNAPHYGGSGVLTSMQDWMRWQQEMISRDVFGDSFWDLMMSTRTFDHPKNNDAFGLVHSDFSGTPMVWFAGGDIDGTSYMLVSTDAKRSAACFSNNPGFDCRAEAEAAFEKVLP